MFVRVLVLGLLLIAAARAADDFTVDIDEDDPEMVAAIAEAQRTCGDFVGRFAAGGADLVFFIKYEVVDGEESEFFWARVTAADDAGFTAVIDNEPVAVTTVKPGQEVRVARGDIADWLIVKDRMPHAGGFSIAVVEKRQAEGAKVKQKP